MRKFITILLMAVLCNSFFYYSYFSFSLTLAKFEAAKIIANSTDENLSSLIKIPSDKLQKDEMDEAWYKEKLYDVVQRKKINDTDYVWLLQDDNEQQILTNAGSYFSNGILSLLQKGYTSSSSRKMSVITDYTIYTAKEMGFYKYSKCSITVNDIFNYSCIRHDVPSPPPKQVWATSNFPLLF